MKRLGLLVLLVLTGCGGNSHTFSNYFYVAQDGSGYRCEINSGTYVTVRFPDVRHATKLCDDLNKALGPYADTYENAPRTYYSDEGPGVAGAPM